MKNIVCMLLAFLLVFMLCACGSTKQEAAEPSAPPVEESSEVTLRQFLDQKEFPAGKTMTVTVVDFVNPFVAVIEDDSGASANLYGLIIGKEMKDFDSLGIHAGMSITIENGQYNVYEGSVEIIEAELVSIN